MTPTRGYGRTYDLVVDRITRDHPGADVWIECATWGEEPWVVCVELPGHSRICEVGETPAEASLKAAYTAHRATNTCYPDEDPE